MELYNAGQYETALGIFEKAMNLPGTGIKQFRQAAALPTNSVSVPFSSEMALVLSFNIRRNLFCAGRDKPPTISNGEKQAALYNIACCQSRLGKTEPGLMALAGAARVMLFAQASS